MTATENVPQTQPSHNSTAPRHGVVTLFGYGTQVRVERGHLVIADGIATERRQFRLARVGHGLKSLVIIGHTGFVTLEALRWLSDQSVGFTMLERSGKVIAVTGPVRPSDAKLRRAQSVALTNGAALKISRDLIAAKLEGQALVMREDLRNPGVADAIAGFRAQLADADSFDRIRLIESQAARAYWNAWGDLPVRYPREDLKLIPEHWKVFGQRVSVLTGSPRLATNPPNAILNYCYALLEAECRLALTALGLDPGIGMLHTDTPARDSLACDLQETVRPQVDAWLLGWLQRELFARSWFFETREGNCRLKGPFAAKLSETASTWRKLVAPWAEFIARELWTTTKKRSPAQQSPPTRLTLQKKREVKGSTYSAPSTQLPRPQRVCADCGTPAKRNRDRCNVCSNAESTKALIEGAKLGRIVASGTEAQRSRMATQLRHDAARREWERSGESPISEEVYRTQVQPKLKNITLRAIMDALKVSVVYASHIRRGKRVPHARHWQALAALARCDLLSQSRGTC